MGLDISSPYLYSIWQKKTFDQIDADFQSGKLSLPFRVDLSKTDSNIEQLKLFVSKIYQLRQMVTLKYNSLKTRRVFTEGKAILERYKICPRTSRLAFLWQKLYFEYARNIGKDSSKSSQFLSIWYLSLSGQDINLKTLPTPEKSPLGPFASLRLKGASLELKSLLNQKEAPEKNWERAFCEAQVSGDPEALISFGRSNGLTDEQTRKLDVFLYCLRKKNTSKKSRRFFKKKDSILDLLDDAATGSSNVQVNLEKVGAGIEKAFLLKDSELVLLYLGAFLRVVYQFDRNLIHARILSELYMKYSFELSGGSTNDSLGVLSDVLSRLEEKNQLNIPRVLHTSYLFLRLVTFFGIRKINQWLAPKRTGTRLNEEDKFALAKILRSHLCQLKGPISKLGQTASYLIEPVDTPFSRELGQLRDQAQPIPTPKIKNLVCNSLGLSNFEEVFTEFSESSIGVGSIGQVHWARLNSGEEVAVKVRDPHVIRNVKTDFRLLRSLIPVLKWTLPNFDFASLFDELEALLLEECDFKNEFKNQVAFREEYKDHPVLRIPKVYPEFSTTSVLVSEYVQGTGLEKFLEQNSDLQIRKKLGIAVAELIGQSCWKGFIYTDPHPGNFIVKDSYVYCVDFGSVKCWGETEIEGWRAGIRASLDPEDETSLETFLKKFGHFRRKGRFSSKDGREVFFGECIKKFGVEGETQFSHDDIRNELKGIRTKSQPLLASFVPNPEYIYAFRAYYGMVGIQAMLGVPMDWSFYRDFVQTYDKGGQSLPSYPEL